MIFKVTHKLTTTMTITDPEVDFPFCFYPSDYRGYVLQSKSGNKTGATAYFRRVTPSKSDTDIPNIRVQVDVQTNNIVRIRITDANNSRWETPYPVVPKSPTQFDFPVLDFNTTDNGRLEIRRSDERGGVIKL